MICPHCGYPHAARNCRSQKLSDAPLETEPHNGPYLGTAPVRTLPPGLFGDDMKHGFADKAKKGHAAQSRLATQRRLSGPNLAASLKSHCVHGHAYTAENTLRDYRGNRKCRACSKARRAKDNARRRKPLDVSRPRR